MMIMIFIPFPAELVRPPHGLQWVGSDRAQIAVEMLWVAWKCFVACLRSLSDPYNNGVINDDNTSGSITMEIGSSVPAEKLRLLLYDLDSCAHSVLMSGTNSDSCGGESVSIALLLYLMSAKSSLDCCSLQCQGPSTSTAMTATTTRFLIWIIHWWL